MVCAMMNAKLIIHVQTRWSRSVNHYLSGLDKGRNLGAKNVSLATRDKVSYRKSRKVMRLTALGRSRRSFPSIRSRCSGSMPTVSTPITAAVPRHKTITIVLITFTATQVFHTFFNLCTLNHSILFISLLIYSSFTIYFTLLDCVTRAFTRLEKLSVLRPPVELTAGALDLPYTTAGSV
jgi:hypothetical protein